LEAQKEIKALIKYYEKRGLDWLDIVCFTANRKLGFFPFPVIRTAIGIVGRKPKKK